MDFMAGMQMAQAGVKTIQGFSDLIESTSSTQKHLMDYRAEVKKTKIHEQFVDNYAQTLTEYALNRSSLLEQKENASSQINTQSADIASQNAVDLEGSSIRSTQVGKLDEEFTKGMNSLLDQNSQNLQTLAANEQAGIAQVKTNLALVHQQINAARAAEVAQGALNVMGGLGDAYQVKQNVVTQNKAKPTQTSSSNGMQTTGNAEKAKSNWFIFG